MKILLLFGGNGVEREISIKTANAIRPALIKLGHTVQDLDFSASFLNDVKNYSPDIVFNAMHGEWGEDGRAVLMLDFLQIPYTHSGYKASKLGMNKFLTKEFAKSLGISCTNGAIVTKSALLEGKYSITQESILKPCTQGSSVLTFKLNNNGLSQDEIEMIKENSKISYLIEDFIRGKEVNVGVLNNKVIGSVEIEPKNDFYDFEAKYTGGKSSYYIPPRINENLLASVQDAALKMHNLLGCNCISRSDFIVTDDSYYFLEINTHPGMTETSLIPKLASNIGITFEDLIKILLDNASFERY